MVKILIAALSDLHGVLPLDIKDSDIVCICGDVFGSNKESVMIIRNKTMLIRKLNLVKFYSRDIIIKCISMFPKYSIIICPIVTVFLLIITKNYLKPFKI